MPPKTAPGRVRASTPPHLTRRNRRAQTARAIAPRHDCAGASAQTFPVISPVLAWVRTWRGPGAWVRRSQDAPVETHETQRWSGSADARNNTGGRALGRLEWLGTEDHPEAAQR